MKPSPRMVIIGNPENRRVTLFKQALAKRGLPAAFELPYVDLLEKNRHLGEIPPEAVLRLESPGENSAVERLLLKAGYEGACAEGGPALSPRDLDRLPDEVGRILFPRQWYLGYVHFLDECDTFLRQRADVGSTASPRDIAMMFDKVACHAHCRESVPVPRSPHALNSFDEVSEVIDRDFAGRVFIKLAHSSSASGIVALEHRGGKFAATTSAEVEMIGGELCVYNSLRVRRYTRLDIIRPLVDFLFAHRAHVEQWLPKASQEGRVCDLRMVMIDGEPSQRVLRTSRSPLTNLHLGNRRGDADLFLAQLTERQRTHFEETCRRTASLFPATRQMGLDILFTPGCRDHYLLEVNAFGDLLPRVLHEGKETYESQVEALEHRHHRV